MPLERPKQQDRAWGALENSLRDVAHCSSFNRHIPKSQKAHAGKGKEQGQQIRRGSGQLWTPCLQAGAHPGIRITRETLLVNRKKQINDGRRELRIYSRVSSRVAECAMTDPQYICSGLLKIYLGSQEAACFYGNEETGLFGILLFFPMCLLTMLSKRENRKTTSTSPPPQPAWSLWCLGTAVTLALSSEPAPPPCVETGGTPETAQLSAGVALDHIPAGTLQGQFSACRLLSQTSFPTSGHALVSLQ